MKTKKRNQGFTLVELLAVIAIIGLLIGIAVPGITIGIERANRLQASANLGSIAKSYNAYAIANARSRQATARTTNDWALQLINWAGGEGPNNPEFWFVDEPIDLNGEDLPESVAIKNRGKWTANHGWNNCSPDYNAVSFYLKTANATSTPLLWTTGIDDTGGEWDDDSPWGGKGGHIAYADGRVEWVDDTYDKLVDFDSKESTDSFLRAIRKQGGNYREPPSITKPITRGHVSSTEDSDSGVQTIDNKSIENRSIETQQIQ